MSRSKMDPSHITQTIYDENMEAIRVHVLPTEIEMNISADSGDSVLVEKKMQILEVKAEQIIDTSKASRMSLVVDQSLEVFAVIGTKEISLGLVGIHPLDLCVPAVKVTADCILILQA